MLDRLAEGEATEVLRNVLNGAKGGDMAAARIVLDRVWPARKSRPVSLSLPEIETPADVVVALGAVADAVGAGDISPDEGAAVASVLEMKRKAIETIELEARIAALEKERRR